jgi:hypothetical protein
MPLLISHCNTVEPTDKPDIPLVPVVVEAINPLPDTMLQLPVPTEGIFPLSVVVGAVIHKD